MGGSAAELGNGTVSTKPGIHKAIPLKLCADSFSEVKSAVKTEESSRPLWGARILPG